MDIVRRVGRLTGRLESLLEARPWLVLVVAALISLPTIVLGEIAAADTRSRLRDAQLEAQTAAAKRAATRANFILADVADHLAEAARSDGPVAVSIGDRKALQSALTQLASRFTYTPAYYFVDMRGVIVAGSSSGAATGPIARVISQRAPTLAWFDSPGSRMNTQLMSPEEMASTFALREVYLSDFYVPRDRSGALMARGSSVGRERPGEERYGFRADMGLRVVDRSGALAGALFVEISAAPFVDAIFELQGISTNAYLIDRNGLVIRRMQYIDPEFVGTDLSSSAAVRSVRRGDILNGDGADPWLAKEALLSSVRVIDVAGTDGANLSVGWSVIAAEPLAELYADVDAGAATLRALRVALVAAILGFATLLALAVRRIVRQRSEVATANVSLERAGRELAAATRHKSEFLANMSHELRTPLNSIIGFADVLEQKLFGDLNAKQAEYVGDISGSGRHLLALVNEILDLSKVEAGRMDLERTEFGIAEMIRSTVTFVRERAASHAIQLSVEMADGLGSANGDERKIRQVLLNLLSNAVKFTPAGGVIRLAAKRDSGELVVSVSDTGIGIAPEDQPKVFEEFRQVGRQTDRSREGTGLGLTLAKRFVELHGGRIWLESVVGKGTTFAFAIPVGHTAASAAPA